MKRPRTVRDVAGRGSKRSVPGNSSPKESAVISTDSFPGQINPKWAWHYRMLLELRDRLLRERRERLAEAAQPLEPHSMDSADAATDEFDHALALGTLSAEQDVLHEIDAAISRICAGSYGRCEESGQAIPAARLRAVPWTRFAREVEARHERAGGIRPPHLGALGSVRGAPTGDLEPLAAAGPTGLEARPGAEKIRPAEPLAADEWISPM